ncbi:hypothetical protein [Rufibacter tibetensis]|uniref:Tissue inhibitor of metalloproteinase n=1 Tax=Rufibacter tibetensis TaxID=512763 RepID=A0A0P0CTU6_9BACT|nr:hypothetical protein [Rufibacter tibetensis]ALI98658.1 hypothetical protein DC20_06365 [Rufibacter tibetensis]
MKLLTLIFLLLHFQTFACDCEPPPVALDFLRSKYVFFGSITEKNIAEDSLTYTVTFRIDKHYKKNGSDPKFLDFTLPLKSQFSTCGSNANKDGKWLVYAYERGAEISFYTYCSNSKRYRALENIDEQELSLLEQGNEIDINEIIFERALIKSAYEEFEGAEPKTQASSLLMQVKPKYYKGLAKTHLERAIIYINKDGEITNIVIPDKSLKYESEMKYDFIHLKYKPADTLTKLQKGIVKVLKQGEPWKPARYNGKTVNSRVFVRITFDINGRLIISDLY